MVVAWHEIVPEEPDVWQSDAQILQIPAFLSAKPKQPEAKNQTFSWHLVDFLGALFGKHDVKKK